MNNGTQHIDLLKKLISIPSFSKEEAGTADVIETYLRSHDIPARRLLNNIWATNRHFDPA